MTHSLKHLLYLRYVARDNHLVDGLDPANPHRGVMSSHLTDMFQMVREDLLDVLPSIEGIDRVRTQFAGCFRVCLEL